MRKRSSDCIIDFHVHPPDIMSERKLSPEDTARIMIREMDEAGICRALLYALEVNVERFLRVVKPSRLVKAVEEAVGMGILSLPPDLLRAVEEPEQVIREHADMLRLAHVSSEHVLEVSRASGGRIIAIASPDPSMPRDELTDRVEKLVDEGAMGVKILPTIQMVDSKLMGRIDAVADVLESKGKVLIIHTGCDPGLWELPSMCEPARPSRFERLARRHRDLTIVLAHMGAYSALKPGIFLHEAIDMMRRLPNVYGDTAALDPEIVEYAVRKVGAGKILFGSDYPVVVGASWRMLVEAVKSIRLPREQVERIMWRNAAEILGLEEC